MKNLRPFGLMLAALPFLFAATGCDDSVSDPPGDADFDLEPGYSLMDPAGPVQLRVEAEVFEAGAPVTLVLENAGEETLGFNLCFHHIERRAGDEWVMDWGNPGPCTTHLNLLHPGDGFDYATTLPDQIGPGEYRFRVAISFMDSNEGRDQVSNTFQVE